jgi:glycosyltransferase involved in cell wall biosynthesis
MITAVILTLNEGIHLERAIASISSFVDRIVVIDSGSTDDTVSIAKGLGAEVYYRRFVTHAEQLNWALRNCDIDSGWVLKLDADEYIVDGHGQRIRAELDGMKGDVQGVTLRLRRVFMGKWLRHGSLYPIRLLRIWRARTGSAQDKLMDEHIQVSGSVVDLDLDFVDHSLITISDWTAKHNNYATKEACQAYLLAASSEQPGEPAQRSIVGESRQASRTNSLRRLYYRISPPFIRPWLYFVYRYIVRFGFLDGVPGLIFHTLHALWYRCLVDYKLYELRAGFVEIVEVKPLVVKRVAK